MTYYKHLLIIQILVVCNNFYFIFFGTSLSIARVPLEHFQCFIATYSFTHIVFYLSFQVVHNNNINSNNRISLLFFKIHFQKISRKQNSIRCDLSLRNEMKKNIYDNRGSVQTRFLFPNSICVCLTFFICLPKKNKTKMNVFEF